MNNSTLSANNWQGAERFLKSFGWLIIVSIAAGLIISHVPILFKHHWSTCNTGGSIVECLWILHIWGVVIIGFSAYYAWYYFKKYQRKNAHQLNMLLLVMNAVNIVYLAFLSGMVLDSIRRLAASWETMTLMGLSIFLVLLVVMGIVTNQKLTRAIYNA